jgi:hypothetical protein
LLKVYFKKRKNKNKKMDEITIPYHLAIPSILCIIGLFIVLLNRKIFFSQNKLLWTSVTIFLILYLLIVGKATFDGIYYQWELNRFDLDKDGLFSGTEITTEQNEAMRNLTSDTGRNFSFLTGFIFASFISTTFYILGRLILKVKKNGK